MKTRKTTVVSLVLAALIVAGTTAVFATSALAESKGSMDTNYYETETSGGLLISYCRVAHDDSFALEHQRFLLQLYAKKAGYTIIGAADEYGSGLTLDRPAIQKVTEAVVAGRVDVVLVHSLTRIGREWGMTQSYIDLLTRHKVKLLCIRDRLLFDENGAAPILTIKNAECPL